MVKSIIAQFEVHDRRIFWSILTCTGIALALYVYFLSVSVYAVVVRKQAESDSERLAARISILESQYVALDKKIDLDLAHQLGFIDISVPRYVSKADTQGTLTMRENVVTER